MKRPSLIQALQELEDLFDYLNNYFYSNILKCPLITIHPESSALGYFREHYANCNGINENEISISLETFEYGPIIVATVLLHEMVHLYNFQYGIKDCSDRQYHNVNFKNEAERVGLIVTQRKGLGFGVTDAGCELEILFKEYGLTKKSFSLRR